MQHFVNYCLSKFVRLLQFVLESFYEKSFGNVFHFCFYNSAIISFDRKQSVRTKLYTINPFNEIFAEFANFSKAGFE